MQTLKESLKTLISGGGPGVPVTLVSNPVTRDTVGRMFDSEQGHQVLTRYFTSDQGKLVLQAALGGKSKKEHTVAINEDDNCK